MVKSQEDARMAEENQLRPIFTTYFHPMQWRQRLLGRRVRYLLWAIGILVLVASAWRVYRPYDQRGCGLLVTTPDNSTYPFHSLSLPDLVPTPLNVSTFVGGLYPTHLIRHPRMNDVFLFTNELRQGAIWGVKLGMGQTQLERLELSGSGGAYPAFCLSSGDYLVCSNYGTPTISLHRLMRWWPFVYHVSTYSFDVGAERTSHPHQVIPHPRIKGIFYVPDLGLNSVHVVRVGKSSIEAIQRWDAGRDMGDGPRHGLITEDGNHLVLAFQSSSTVAVIPVNQTGHLGTPTRPSISTIPLTAMETTYALSDIKRVGTAIYVLNRQVLPPYTGEGDTIAKFELSDGQLDPTGHIQLPCYHPRELRILDKSTMAVTCVGGDGEKGGVVLLEDEQVHAYWQGPSTWGVAETLYPMPV